MLFYFSYIFLLLFIFLIYFFPFVCFYAFKVPSTHTFIIKQNRSGDLTLDYPSHEILDRHYVIVRITNTTLRPVSNLIPILNPMFYSDQTLNNVSRGSLAKF